jgi:proteasome lid subunit RPN8/RPN11
MSPSPTTLLSEFGIQQRGKAIGVIYADAPVVLMQGNALDALVAYSMEDLQREQGAFLLGVRHTKPSAPHGAVEVRHFVRATETRNSSGAIAFTPDTWAAFHQTAREQYPQETLLGWHHTHPGINVFLSPYDLFIHRHFFREPWHIALVVDPCRREFGFFQWRKNEIVDCGFICVESA